MNLFFSSQVYFVATITCSLLVVILGAAATYQKDQETERAEKQHQAELLGKSEEITTLSAEIMRLQGAGIEELQHQTSLLTGGNSFPLVEFRDFNDDGQNIVFPMLWVRGRYPIRDISWRMIVNDATGRREFSGDISVHRPVASLPFGKVLLEFGSVSEVTARVIIQANNGTWVQSTEFRVDDEGKIETKTLVRPDNQRDVVLVDIDFGQPIPIGSFEDYFANQYQR